MAVGDIFYSFRGQRFYQEGRRGAVGRDVAIRSLRYDPDAQVFRDSRGNSIKAEILAPADRVRNNLIAHDKDGRPFISTQQDNRTISPEQVAATRPNANQELIARVVVYTPDGKAHVFSVSNGFGRAANPEELLAKAQRIARSRFLDPIYTGGDPYDLSTPDVGKSTVSISYQVRTTNIVKP